MRADAAGARYGGRQGARAHPAATGRREVRARPQDAERRPPHPGVQTGRRRTRQAPAAARLGRHGRRGGHVRYAADRRRRERPRALPEGGDGRGRRRGRGGQMGRSNRARRRGGIRLPVRARVLRDLARRRRGPELRLIRRRRAKARVRRGARRRRAHGRRHGQDAHRARRGPEPPSEKHRHEGGEEPTSRGGAGALGTGHRRTEAGQHAAAPRRRRVHQRGGEATGGGECQKTRRGG